MLQGAKRRRTIGAAKTAPEGAALRLTDKVSHSGHALPRPAALAVSLAATL